MGLHVDYLEVKEFRSYEWFLLELSKSLTIIEGPNAAGKTNLIEALQLLTAGESFRRPRWDDVIREGSGAARISMVASGDNRELTVLMDVVRGEGRSYRVNGSRKRTVSAATGTLPCVVFNPEDLSLAKGTSAVRRDALDALGSQLSSTYDSLRSEYAKILRQRNAVLREGMSADQLDVWTGALAVTGGRLMKHRRRLLERMQPHVVQAYEQITDGEQMQLVYQPSWERTSVAHGQPGGMEAAATEDLLGGFLEASASEERARGVTVVGPHRDDIVFNIEGMAARTFASQGQQRSLALAWKLGEVAATEEILGSKPLLLLDDVMSELDESRRHALASTVLRSVQTVMTTTNLHYFDESLLKAGSVVSLPRG